MLGFLKNNRFLTLFGFIVFVVMFLQGAWLQPDSPGYISGDVSRSFLYPLFLRFFSFFSPGNYTLVIFIQFFIGLSTVFYTLSKLTNWFALNVACRYGIFVILLLPYIGHTKIGNTILTEPLCYPLFMIFFVSLFESFYEKKSLVIPLVCSILLTCTRKQFYFIFAAFYFLILLDFLRLKKLDILKVILPVIAFLFCTFIEYVNVYRLSGRFSPIPSAVQFISTPLFIAKPENLAYLKDAQQKIFLESALQEREKYQVGIHDKYTSEDFMFPVYMKFEVVHDFFRFKALPIALSKVNILDHEKDDFVKKLSFELIKLNFESYLRVYRASFVHGLGGYYPFAILCVFFVLGTYLTIRFFNPFGIFLSIASFLQIVDYGVVALIQPILRRYVFYTDTFYLISVFLLLYAFYQLICKKPS